MIPIKFQLTREFLVTHQQQLEPLRPSDVGNRQGSSVGFWQTLWTDMFVEQIPVIAHEDDSGTELFFQERLEDCEYHVEDERLVDDV